MIMVCSPVSFFLMQSGLRLQSVRLQKKLSAGFPCFRSVFAYAIVSREVLLPSRCMRKRVQSVRSARTKGPPPLAPPLWEGKSPPAPPPPPLWGGASLFHSLDTLQHSLIAHICMINFNGVFQDEESFIEL